MRYPKVATGLLNLGTDLNWLFRQLPNANLNRWGKGEYISISITLASCALVNGCSGSLLLETGMAAGCFSVDCDTGGDVSASWVMITSGHNAILTGYGGSLCSPFIGLLSSAVSGLTMSFHFCTLVWLGGLAWDCHKAKSSCSKLFMCCCADKDKGVNMLVSQILGWVLHVAMVYFGVGCGSEILLLNTIYISCGCKV